MSKILNGKKFYIKTYGCQMNFHDSDKMSIILKNSGMISVDDKSQADVIILNTCHIREKAKHKVYTELGFLKAIKNKRNKMGLDTIFAVGGCVGQAEGEELLKAVPHLNLVFGTQNYHSLPEMLESIFNGNETKNIADKDQNSCSITRLVDIEFPEENKMDYLPKNTELNGSAFIAIQEGCDKFCSYCVVPYTRGIEISRDVSSIIEEAKEYAKIGIKEITLLGQNVNAYRGVAPVKSNTNDTWSFARLIREVANVDGIERIFYTSSHPIDIEEDLIIAHAEISKLMPFIHLPVQSGSDAILQKMNRRHTADEYIRIINKFKECNPNIAFSSDFIVGFPGETDENFKETLLLVEKIKYSQAFSFKYSKRPGTLACDMNDQVDEDVKIERLKILQDLLQQQQISFNNSCIGKTLSVMFQKFGKHKNQILGKSEYMQSVIVETENPSILMNQIRRVKIISATASSLEGIIEN